MQYQRLIKLLCISDGGTVQKQDINTPKDYSKIKIEI